MRQELLEFRLEVCRLNRLRAEVQAQAGFDAQQWDAEASLHLRPLLEKLTPQEILPLLLASEALRIKEDS